MMATSKSMATFGILPDVSYPPDTDAFSVFGLHGATSVKGVGEHLLNSRHANRDVYRLLSPVFWLNFRTIPKPLPRVPDEVSPSKSSFRSSRETRRAPSAGQVAAPTRASIPRLSSEASRGGALYTKNAKSVLGVRAGRFELCAGRSALMASDE